MKCYPRNLLLIAIVLSIIAYQAITIQQKDQKIYSQKSKIQNKELKIKQLNDLLMMGFSVGGEGYKEDDMITAVINPLSIDNYEWRFESIEIPLDGCFITSEFNDKRKDKAGGVHYEKSTDFKSLKSKIIKCGIDGVVQEIGYNEIYGNYIIVKGYEVIFDAIKEVEIKYSHLEKVKVKENQIVIKEQHIGLMGNTGHCMVKDFRLSERGVWRDIRNDERLEDIASHLDFELKIDGVCVNPLANSLY
jgi:murein DD-endopeptidase MepM/ murein hydrolase activator NlpD